MAMTGSGTKPKPSLPIRQALAGVDEDDEALRAGIEWVASASHAQRATFAAVSEADGEGISAQRAGGAIPWSTSSARAAIETMSDEGLATVDDGWPALATLTETGERVIEALRSEGIDLTAEYLHAGSEQEPEPEPEQEPESESESESEPTSPSERDVSNRLDDLAASLAGGEGASGDSNPGGSEPESASRGGSSASNTGTGGAQTWDERPAASWDEPVPPVEPGDARDVLAETIIDLAGEMGARAGQERQSGLETARVRALQANAFANLVIALDTIRDGGDDDESESESESER